MQHELVSQRADSVIKFLALKFMHCVVETMPLWLSLCILEEARQLWSMHECTRILE